MKKAFFIICIFLVSACAADGENGASQNGTTNSSGQPVGLINAIAVDVAGVEREYNLYIPSTTPDGPILF